MAADPSANPRFTRFDQAMYNNKTVKRYIEGKFTYIEVRGEVRDYCFRNSIVEEVYIPNATKLGTYVFYYAQKLRIVTCPNVTNISGTNCFYANYSLEHVYLPKCTQLNSRAFSALNSVPYIHFGKVNESTIKATTWYKNHASSYHVVFDL